jgi:hypothetical protein
MQWKDVTSAHYPEKLRGTILALPQMGLMLHILLIDVFRVHEPNMYYYNAMTLYTPI